MERQQSFYIISKLQLIEIRKSVIICEAERLNTPLFFYRKSAFKVFLKIINKPKFKNKNFKIRFTKNSKNEKILRFISPWKERLPPQNIFSSKSFRQTFDWDLENDFLLPNFAETSQCRRIFGIENNEIENCFGNIKGTDCLFGDECDNYPFDLIPNQVTDTLDSFNKLQTIFDFILASITDSKVGDRTIIQDITSKNFTIQKGFSLDYEPITDFCECRAIFLHFLILKFAKSILNITETIRANVIIAPKPSQKNGTDFDNTFYYNNDKLNVKWNFHVAPCLTVEENGILKDYVLDPTINLTRPLLVSDWFNTICPPDNPEKTFPIKMQGWVRIESKDSIDTIISLKNISLLTGLGHKFIHQTGNKLATHTSVLSINP